MNSTAKPQQFAFDPQIFLSHVSQRAGVYQMRDAKGVVIYVGKAKNLQKRLASYFRTSALSAKTLALMQAVRDIETTVTASEAEALLLENNLIKTHQPRYNILLRDDKSFPYIKFSAHKFPQISIFRRGGSLKSSQAKNSQLFGPYPSGAVARFALENLQKIFRLRECRDSEFNNRSRPCLQYQIGRCYAPCVGYISPETYQEVLQMAAEFLRGNNAQLLNDLQNKMFSASEAQKYEEAALIRDQIKALHKLHENRRIVAGDDESDADYLAAHEQYGETCVQVLFYRAGETVASETYFPKIPEPVSAEEILEAFIGQYYSQRLIPQEIVANISEEARSALEEYLSLLRGKKTRIINRPRGQKKEKLDMAIENAKINLSLQVSAKLSMQKRFIALQKELHLAQVPQRIECADISHFQGENTIASCVVFDHRGALKQEYRHYKITGITLGDDFAAMAQVLRRRFTRLKKENSIMPDVFFVDGGKGQLSEAMKVLQELEICGVQLIGVAKGENRKRGLEQFWFPDEQEPRRLSSDSQAMQLIVQIRDEAHRFAITGHRKGRDKKLKRSSLENIAGIGSKRRRALLNFFGGIRELESASIDEIAKVEGISRQLAAAIYQHLHS